VNSLFRSLRSDNGDLRGLTGSGEPGMHTLLGGTGEELTAAGTSLASGGGASTGYAKLARAHKDVRMASLAAAAASGSIASGGVHEPGRGRYQDR
jgi:hypothetical protein